MRRSLQIHLPYVRIKHLQLNYRAILTRRPSSYFTGLHHHHHHTLARTYTCKSKFSSNIEKGSQGAISGAKDSRSEAPVMSIHLTERERSICDLLTQVCSYVRKAHPNLPPVTLRINGGWVRDKLLGLESHDVDIAIDTMMGYEFATHVNDFMSSQNQQIRSIAKIERNPDQSKHLETARMKILDYEVDLVNLRSETYSEESRIPSNTDFGTPTEDANRRDITINALFFNIHTGKVEDFTGKGLDDLRSGIIRTPLEAYDTFKDDPLRILRCIRFAARLHFRLDNDIVQAIKDDRIMQALRSKISRERIGIEVDKMLSGAHAYEAFHYLIDLELYDAVLPLPPDDLILSMGDSAGNGFSSDVARLKSVASRLQGLVENPAAHGLSAGLNPEQYEEREMRLALCAMPFKHMTYRQVSMKKGGITKPAPGIQYAIVDALKLSKRDYNVVVLYNSSPEFVDAIKQDVEQGKSQKVALGRFIRNLARKFGTEYGARWSSALLYTTAVSSKHSVQMVNEIADLIRSFDLQNIHLAQPILNGRQVAEFLGIKPGPRMSDIMEVLAEWQIEQHPIKDEDQCRLFLREYFQSKNK